MNLIWLVILFIPILLYLTFSLILRIGLHHQYETISHKNLTVSVVVAARNEEDCIYDCLTSLSKLDYPAELLEIIIVNDRSVDHTDHIISQFIKDKPCFKYFNVKEVNKNLSGKASAVSMGIEKSRGEIIFVTDADCVVPISWIRGTLSYFRSDIGLVAGFTLIKAAKGLFSRLQNIDWAYLLSVASGAIGLKIPLTCMGNNFAVRRSTYDKIGGYEGAGFSLTEDFALLKAIADSTDWKITFPVDSDCLVKSMPLTSLKDFFSQRKRWAIGGNSVHWFGKFLIFLSIITHFTLIGFLFSSLYFHFIFVLVLILLSDYILLKYAMKRLKLSKFIKYLPFYKIFFVFYLILLLIQLILNQKITWKGIIYTSDEVIGNKQMD